MQTRSVVAVVASLVLVIAALALIVARGGVLAWVGAVLGVSVFAKAWLRPALSDMWLSIAAVTLWALVWAGTYYYVISTWESGEVVDLAIQLPGKSHTARVWVMDSNQSVILYYDADPDIAYALLSGAPIQVTRAGKPLKFSYYTAESANDIPEPQSRRILQLMSDKYGDLNVATDVFYVMLGSYRDRVGTVITLGSEESAGVKP